MENVIEKFIDYQDSYKEVIEELISDKKYHKDWKGFITLNGPIVEQPDILFIGINPGPGLYNVVKNKMPFKILKGGKLDESFFSENVETIKFIDAHPRKDGTIALDCFTAGNYKDGKWYNGNYKPRNKFAWNIVTIIHEVAECLKYGKFKECEKPEWYKEPEKYNNFAKKYLIRGTFN